MGYIKTQRFDRKFSFCPRHPQHSASSNHPSLQTPASEVGGAVCTRVVAGRWPRGRCALPGMDPVPLGQPDFLRAHGGRCRAPATVPSTRLLNQCWWRAGLEGCRVRADGRRALAARAPRPARYGSCAAGPARPRARAWWAVPRPRNQSGARTPAAARSRVAAAACVTAAAVAHARTVSNPGLFVPTVNRGVEL